MRCFPLVLSVFLLSCPAQADEYVKLERLPLLKDFVQVWNPEGFKHAFEKHALNRFIQEYVPAGESVHDWSKMLSVSAIGASEKFPPLSILWKKFSDSFKDSCKSLDINDVSVTETEASFRMDCTVGENLSLPGTNTGKREIALYRFVRTSEAVYQMHFAWHGDDKAIGNETNRSAFYAEAEKALSNVIICNMASLKPCRGVDSYFDFTTRKELPLENPPPCHRENVEPCKPTAFFLASPVDGADPEKKDGLLTLSFSDLDLRDLKVANGIANKIIKELQDGRKVLFLVTAPNPDHIPTPEERTTVSTLFTFLRLHLTAIKMADPDRIAINFTNFR